MVFELKNMFEQTSNYSWLERIQSTLHAGIQLTSATRWWLRQISFMYTAWQILITLWTVHHTCNHTNRCIHNSTSSLDEQKANNTTEYTPKRHALQRNCVKIRYLHIKIVISSFGQSNKDSPHKVGSAVSCTFLVGIQLQQQAHAFHCNFVVLIRQRCKRIL